jgi:protein ImuB
VYRAPLAADVVDARDVTVTVSGRGGVGAEPARLSIDRGPWVGITAWAGPWPLDERWWTAAHRRRARWQVVTTDGHAHLLAVEGSRWFVEASYE